MFIHEDVIREVRRHGITSGSYEFVHHSVGEFLFNLNLEFNVFSQLFRLVYQLNLDCIPYQEIT